MEADTLTLESIKPGRGIWLEPGTLASLPAPLDNAGEWEALRAWVREHYPEAKPDWLEGPTPDFKPFIYATRRIAPPIPTWGVEQDHQ